MRRSFRLLPTFFGRDVEEGQRFPHHWRLQCGAGVAVGDLGMKAEGRTAQLDYIVVPRRTSKKVFLHNDVKTWDSWDHSPNYAVVQDNEASN